MSKITEITPEAYRCVGGASCPAVFRSEDGAIVVIGRELYSAEWLAKCGDGEAAVQIDAALLEGAVLECQATASDAAAPSSASPLQSGDELAAENESEFKFLERLGKRIAVKHVHFSELDDLRRAHEIAVRYRRMDRDAAKEVEFDAIFSPLADMTGDDMDAIIDDENIRLTEELIAARSENAELRKALEPFAVFAHNVDDEGWTSNIHRESISTWFGPSDFRCASAVLSRSAPRQIEEPALAGDDADQQANRQPDTSKLQVPQ